MKLSWTVPVSMAVLMTIAGACNRTQSRTGGAAERPATATVALSGCLEAAPGTNRYVLRNVRFEPRAGDPHASTTTSGGHGITEGAWVKLDGGEKNLTSYLGQRVTLTGIVTDDGRNTIGTGGSPGAQTPSGDTSQASSRDHYSDKVKMEAGRIARESIADGTGAEIRVTNINGTGDRCDPPRPVGR
jgi:hypothetical protein